MVVLTLLWVISVLLSVHMTNPVFENYVHFPPVFLLLLRYAPRNNHILNLVYIESDRFLVSTETMFTLIDVCTMIVTIKGGGRHGILGHALFLYGNIH